MEKSHALLGAKIRGLRKQAGFTISQLAEMAGIDGGFLNYIENDKKSPSLETLEKLSNALNVSLSDLFAGQIINAKNPLDYQISSQIRAILTGKNEDERKKFLMVLKNLKDKDTLAAIFRILKKTR